jgi:amino acid transporter
LEGLPWDDFGGGFETLVAGSAPAYWTLCLATGIAAIVLRFRDPHSDRPYRMPFFPLPALAFCATCLFMLYSAQAYARWLTLIGFVPLAIGGVVCLFVRRKKDE